MGRGFGRFLPEMTGERLKLPVLLSPRRTACYLNGNFRAVGFLNLIRLEFV